MGRGTGRLEKATAYDLECTVAEDMFSTKGIEIEKVQMDGEGVAPATFDTKVDIIKADITRTNEALFKFSALSTTCHANASIASSVV